MAVICVLIFVLGISIQIMILIIVSIVCLDVSRQSKMSMSDLAGNCRGVKRVCLLVGVCVCTGEEEAGVRGQPTERWYSMFPVENDCFIYGRWEDDIIWDNQVGPTSLGTRTETVLKSLQ